MNEQDVVDVVGAAAVTVVDCPATIDQVPAIGRSIVGVEQALERMADFLALRGQTDPLGQFLNESLVRCAECLGVFRNQARGADPG